MSASSVQQATSSSTSGGHVDPSARDRYVMKKSYSIENGYGGRRRSLVDDARFETLVNKQNRESLANEVTRLSREDSMSEEEVFGTDESLIPESDEKGLMTISLVIGLRDNMAALARSLKTVHNCKGQLLHVESRAVKEDESGCFEVILQLRILRDNLIALIKLLKQSVSLNKVYVSSPSAIPANVGVNELWFPKHISELDLCNHIVTRYEPDLDDGHPGFTDRVYRARRKQIADIAFNYKHGEPIPRVEYTADERGTWATVYKQLVTLLPSHACRQHNEIFAMLERECGYREDNIPQLEDISNFLKRKTGFSLRPAAGLLTARDFLASLAYRVFQCTQYIRHSSSPYHSPEPDCVHELLGHVPMLADKNFAQFSQELGLASLGASDSDIEKFATMYWFTIEFGLCRENGQVRAFGAGLLSSYGELMHSLSSKPQLLPYDPNICAVQPYQDQEYQDVYFVAESVEDALYKFRRWVAQNIKRPYEVCYNPFTQSMEIVDSVTSLTHITNQIQEDLAHVCTALNKLK